MARASTDLALAISSPKPTRLIAAGVSKSSSLDPVSKMADKLRFHTDSWDLSVDPLNRPALRPFEQVEQMVEKTQRIFDQLDPELALPDGTRLAGRLDAVRDQAVRPAGAL